jgi:stage V sporulation protein S
MEILKVKATSVPNSVAGALAGVIRERGTDSAFPPRFFKKY